jgi:predicted MFS family arabinose efflux permease
VTAISLPRPRSRHATGFWFVALAFGSLMAFGTLPTPLWPLYQARDHFGPTQVTIAFAVMVAGAAVSFGALGHLSDRFGRRRIIAPALVAGIGAALVLAAWPTLPGLIVGRVLTGIAVGLMASTATAYLTDLHREAHPDRAGSGVPMLTSTVANLGGLALGPLVAGIVAQWLPAPLVTSYLLLAGVMAGLLMLVLSTPETVDRLRGRQASPSRFALRPGAAQLFGAAAAVGFFAFALMGFFSSLGAIVVRGQLGITSTFVVGLAPFTAFAASAAAQILLGTATQRRLLVVGSWLFPVGLAVTAAALYHPTLGWFLTGAALAGAGAGLLFKAAATQTVLAAEPASRAGVLAVFFIIAYAGMGLPSIAFSIVIRYAALAPTMVGFGTVLAVGTIAAVVTATRRIQ